MQLHDDFRRAKKLHPDPVIIAVNEAGRDHEGQLDHWASMHSDILARLVKERARAEKTPAGSLWLPRHISAPPELQTRRAPSWGGSSGLLAVAVAFELGFTRILLCGVPLERSGAHYFNTKRLWDDAARYRPAWQKNLEIMRDKVKSMSGWTAELLGQPDKAWLNA